MSCVRAGWDFYSSSHFAPLCGLLYAKLARSVGGGRIKKGWASSRFQSASLDLGAHAMGQTGLNRPTPAAHCPNSSRPKKKSRPQKIGGKCRGGSCGLQFFHFIHVRKVHRRCTPFAENTHIISLGTHGSFHFFFRRKSSIHPVFFFPRRSKEGHPLFSHASGFFLQLE